MLATASTTYAGVKVAAKTTAVTKRANVITRAGNTMMNFCKLRCVRRSRRRRRRRRRRRDGDIRARATWGARDGVCVRRRVDANEDVGRIRGGNVHVILRVVCIRSHRRPVAIASTRVAMV